MDRILGIITVVEDIEKAIQFYCSVLDFTKIGQSEIKGELYEQLYEQSDLEGHFAILQLGEDFLYLIEFRSTPGHPHLKDIRSNDLAFQHIAIVVSDMEKAYRKLVENKVTSISKGPQTIPESNLAAAGIQAFYFRSPDGAPLELIYYPSDKGRPEWQSKKNLFLGIDHTAITISNTEKSYAFYHHILGLKTAGESLNEGVTQENLSNVPKAKVKITSLRHHETQGMGLEFLHYLQPAHFDSSTPNIKPNDLGLAHTVIKVDDLSLLLEKLQKNHIPIVSTGLFHPYSEVKFENAIIIADPDKHRLLIVENQGDENDGYD